MKSNAIHWLVLLIVVTVAGGGLYYEYQNTRPCIHPISYTIGAVDARFGITNTELISESNAAAMIWNKTAGKTILAYDPQADLKISLMYDARESNAKLGSEIARQQAENDNVRAALDALRSQYTTEQINSKIASYNASIAVLNAKIAEFNRTAGRTFEEGQYVRDSSGERITIFEFIGNAQLERVLAHEFGHAIGLDHNSDPKSIMFAKNESGNLVPTVSDLAALKAVCGL